MMLLIIRLLLWCGPGSLPAGRQGTLRQLLFSIPKNKKPHPPKANGASVVWAGIEPATQGFSVLCSTD